MMARHNTAVKIVQSGDADFGAKLAALHAVSSGLKAWLAETVSDGVESCRRLCGGHGFTQSSNLAHTFAEIVGANTFEGTFDVLVQQHARYLLKILAGAKTLDTSEPATQFLSKIMTYADPKLRCKAQTSVDFGDLKLLVEAFEARAGRVLLALASKMKGTNNDGNACMVLMTRVSTAHTELMLMEALMNGITTIPSGKERQATINLCSLLGVWLITKSLGDFRQHDYLSSQQADLVCEQVVLLLPIIRKNCVLLADAWDFSDFELNSTIGRYDGDIYRALVKRAADEPLNKTQVPEGYEVYLKPLIQGQQVVVSLLHCLMPIAPAPLTIFICSGLPQIISSGNPEPNTVEMGKRISDWDIVNVQEDFNYHAFLYSKNTHEHRTATSGGVPFGSGLNTLSHYPFTNVSGTERTQWKACSSNEGADCLTPKGFTRVEIQLDGGVAFDLYNLHSDAGTSAEDQKARASNLAQLGDYIKANSADKAVIVMGDTNTRYTRSLDTIAEFLQGTNLTDGWVEFVRNGKAPEKGAAPILCDEKNMTNECEVVDKIMYRGNNYITLTLDKWNNDNKAFFDSNKTGLSDHPPISSVFSWKLNPDLHLSDAFGGPHGTPFTDVALAAAGQTVSSITIRAEKRVDGVSLEVSDPTESTLAHGGTGGIPKKLQLKSGEYITSMEVHWGKKEERTRIFYLKFKTNKGRSVEGGTKTSAKATVTAPKGFQLSGLHGRSDKEVDALGAIFTRIESTSQSQLQTTQE
ncbi:hypothetical protein JM18_007252 [Phytophthora kernoviae]|uniref:Jacalin-type lectin domain-containing protein n=1 Tax=Phytophthora kernoviae TaxID=325452 RepID=A0A8T0LQ70_9STRA|nr:hypothetical protein JM16_007357 [Phytophthora kernoviae]KAG2520155.1 hypothetical protein JM18_007252 [Phytophthora kernoviae]